MFALQSMQNAHSTRTAATVTLRNRGTTCYLQFTDAVDTRPAYDCALLRLSDKPKTMVGVTHFRFAYPPSVLSVGLLLKVNPSFIHSRR